MADKSTTTKPVKTKAEAPVATDAPAVEITKKDADTSTATKPAVKTKKSKRKQSVPAGHVHIYATFNNTIITVTDKHGNTLAASSAGACGFRGSKKGTAYAAQVASEKATNTAKQNYGLAKVDVFVDGIGLGRDAAIRALQNTELTVESIKDVTTIPHGGTRPPKPRRG